MKKIYALFLLFAAFSLSVKAQVVINEVYGGGGNSGATFKQDFIELYNNGTTAVDLTGWSVQYASSAGSSWSRTNLSGSIPAKGYYLIQQATGTGGTTNIPTPNATGTIAMSGTAGKVALVSNATTLTGACPTGTDIIDFVGFGSGTNCFEGAAPTPAPSNTNSVQRTPVGTDTQKNNLDFTAGAPTPTAAAAGDITAPIISSTSPAANSVSATTSFTATITFNETIQKGTTGTIVLKELATGATVQSIDLAKVAVSGSTASFDVASLPFGIAYYFEISSGAFKDLANNTFASISGSTAWNFTTPTTPPSGTLSTTYSFTTCGPNFPDGFTQYSVLGDPKWSCTTFGKTGNGAQMSGFSTENVPNKDWLISPAFNLTGTVYPLLSFWSRTKFNGDPLELKISTDYSGTGLHLHLLKYKQRQ